MKFCTQCGAQAEDSTRFCMQCGNRFPIEEAPQSEAQTAPEAEIAEGAEETVLMPVRESAPQEQIQEAEEVSQENVQPDQQEAEIEIAIEPEEAVQTETEEEAENVEPESFVGKTCPFCKTVIGQGDEFEICPACNMAHHKACWDENGGCTTFGCTGKPKGTVICFNCGADIAENQAFCVKCGSPKPAEAVAQPAVNPNVCPKCNTALSEGQKFCSNCGAGAAPMASPAANPAIDTYNSTVTQKKKPEKNKLIIGAFAGVLALLIIIIGISSSNRKKIETYYETAEAFGSLSLDCGANLEDVGNDIQTYWSKYIYTAGSTVYYNGHYMYDIDDAVGYALSDNSYLVSQIKTQWGEIQDLYGELKDLPGGDSEIEALWDDIQDVYDALEEMYDCVINVSGNYTTYKSNFSSCDSELADALKDLNNNF